MPQAFPRKTPLAFGIKQLDNKFQFIEQFTSAPVGAMPCHRPVTPQIGVTQKSLIFCKFDPK